METSTRETTHESIAASLGLQPTLFVFQLINFLLVLCVVWFLILKPLVTKLEERRKTISETLDNAEKIKTDLGMAETRARDMIDEAKVEANNIVERRMVEAEKEIEIMKKKTRSDIELLVAQAKKNIEIDKADMRESLRKETAGLVVLAVEKVLKEKMDPKKDEAFLRSLL